MHQSPSELGVGSLPGAGQKSIFALLLLIILGSFALRLAYISVPYADPESKSDGIAASTYMVSKNYLRYGYAETRGLQILNAQETAPDGWVTYLNHPASFVLLQSLVFHCSGGESLWAAKIAPLLAVIAQLLLLYRLVRRRYSRVAAMTSVALYAMWPMSLLYGGHPNYEPFAILSMLLFVDRWQERKRGQAYLAVFVGGLFDFTAFYPPFFLAIWLLINRRFAQVVSLGSAFKQATMLAIPCIAALAIHFAHISFAQRGGSSIAYVQELLRQAMSRDSQWIASTVNFSWGSFFASQSSFLLAGFGLLGLALALFGFFQRTFPPGTLLLLISGLAHHLVFRYHAHVHEFWGLYLSAPLAMAAGPGLLALHSRLLPAAKPQVRTLIYAALLMLVSSAGLIRYLDHQESIDYQAPQRWAETMETGLPRNSVALLLRQDGILPRGIECLTEELAVWGFLAPANEESIKLMGSHLREYQLQNRRVFVVLEASALSAYEDEHGAAKVREILEAGLLRGIRQEPFDSADGSLTFYSWDVTEAIFR